MRLRVRSESHLPQTSQLITQVLLSVCTRVWPWRVVTLVNSETVSRNAGCYLRCRHHELDPRFPGKVFVVPALPLARNIGGRGPACLALLPGPRWPVSGGCLTVIVVMLPFTSTLLSGFKFNSQKLHVSVFFGNDFLKLLRRLSWKKTFRGQRVGGGGAEKTHYRFLHTT